MAKFKVSILEYLGKLDIGVMSLVSIVYNDKYYEATYFYTDERLVLTVQEELEIDLGHRISDDENYADLIREIISKVVPYGEIYGRLDEIDFNRWSIENSKL
jgi:hypothetical protein